MSMLDLSTWKRLQNAPAYYKEEHKPRTVECRGCGRYFSVLGDEAPRNGTVPACGYCANEVRP